MDRHSYFINTWWEELQLLKDDESGLLGYYIMVVIYDFLEALRHPVGLLATVGVAALLVWLFWKAAAANGTPADKLRKRASLILLALAYVLLPSVVIGWSAGSMLTWMFAIPPVLFLAAALYLLVTPAKSYS